MLRLELFSYRFYAPRGKVDEQDPLAAQHMVQIEYEFLGNSPPNYIDAEGLMGDGISEGTEKALV